MRRRTFDILMSAGGLVLAVVLFVAGGLALWGHDFANDNVRNQLADQQIFFPAKDNKQLADPRIGPYISKYAGQQVVTGPQAEAFADHYIKVHLSETADGQTYAQVSAKAQADPDNTELAAQVQTLFRGETLRGLLLEAYGFWKIGQIALIASIVSFSLGGVMLLLTVFGFLHLRRTSPAEDLTFGRHAREAAPQPASS